MISVVSSGALDDGTAGLWTIKQRGGLAIVQDPSDAEVPSMPESARREVAVDYSVPLAEMARLLVRLSSEEIFVRRAVLSHERLSKDSLLLQAGDENGD